MIKVDPPKGMLEYVTSEYYVTLYSTETASMETMPYKVIAVYQEARQISVRTPEGNVRVPITRIASHWK